MNKAEQSSFNGRWLRLKNFLATPTNGASLAAFRFALGLVMALEAYSLFRPNVAAISTGLSPLQTYFTSPEIKFHFPFESFQWVPLVPAQWIYFLVGLQALAGLTMALGLWYRLSASTVFLIWGYLFVVESTRTYWQSHYYLETLLTFLMIWMPAARRFSLDAWLARNRNQPRSVPYWAIVLLRGQLLIAYFYAGVAKLNADWLLDAVPTRWVLAQPSLMAPYEPYLTTSLLEFIKGILQSAWFAYFINYAGALFDLSVGFLFLFRRTRLFAMILLVLFHATNHFIIFDDIGWFPLVGVTTAFIFLNPDWPERFWNRLRATWRVKTAKRKGSKAEKGRHAEVAELTQAGPSGGSVPLSGLQILSTLFVVGWLLWQTLLPIRHFLIPADSRFTYEAQSFSWRLKADVRRSSPAEIYVQDPLIIPAGNAGDADGPTGGNPASTAMRINWQEWHGDRVLYRRMTPGRIDWERLPEVIVCLEPVIGERLIYNPFAVSVTNRTEAALRQRVSAIWQNRYGRQPQDVRSTVGLPYFLRSVANGLRAGGNSQEAAELERFAAHGENPEAVNSRSDLLDLLLGLRLRDKAGGMTPFFRSLPPFALAGEPAKPVPFLVIDDPVLIEAQRHSTNEPLVIYTADLGPEGKELLPQVCLFDSQEHPEQPPDIWWNSPKDLTASKLMHVSTQPFYLRRYARRVAELWQREHGRRPIVRASTSMSFNGRPPQPLVDPAADLATVSVLWFRHNHWIKDLETPRIPRSAIATNPGFTSE